MTDDDNIDEDEDVEFFTPGNQPRDLELYTSLIFSHALMAAIFGMAPESLHRLVRQGTVKRNARTGLYDCQAITDYIGELRQKGLGGAMAHNPDAVEELAEANGRAPITGQNAMLVKLIEEARLTRAKADAEEQRVMERNGELLPADMVLELCAPTAVAVRQTLLVMHTRLKSLVPDVSDEIAQAVRDIAHEALTEISETGVPDELARRMAVRHDRKGLAIAALGIAEEVVAAEEPAAEDDGDGQALLFGDLFAMEYPHETDG